MLELHNDTLSNDQWAEELEGVLFQTASSVIASLCLVLYDNIITFDQEVQ